MNCFLRAILWGALCSSFMLSPSDAGAEDRAPWQEMPHARADSGEVVPAGYEWSPNPSRRPHASSDDFESVSPARRQLGSPRRLLDPDVDAEPLMDEPAPWQQSPRPGRGSMARRAQYELPPQSERLRPRPDPMGSEGIEPGVVDGPGPQMVMEGDAGMDYGGHDAEGFPLEYGGYSCGHDHNGWHRCKGVCCPHAWLDESSLLVGVHGFKNPSDLGRNGNFGFQEGVNFAGPLWHYYGIGYQVGAQFVQSNLSGSTTANVEDNSRDQAFLTAGVFRRALCDHGFQFGAVFDYLHDKYFDDARFTQVRAELSFLHRCHELGFWGAFGTSGIQTVTTDNFVGQFQSMDMYTFFYRRNLRHGGQGRVWGGFTSDRDGIFGADFRVPINNRWDLISGVNYVIPSEGSGVGGSQQEAWGLTMNLVWYPTRPRRGCHNGPYRQLFGVADNNTLIIDAK